MNSSKKEKTTSRLRTLIGVLRKRDVIHGITPEKLKLILEDMGPTYIKIGQIMSMRSDILPEEFCNELRELRTQVRPVPFKDVMKVMEQEWGRAPVKIFSFIDETPLGSASIAQVYTATLKGSDEQVVIKVQRPGIYDMMAQDVKLMHKVIGLMHLAPVNTDTVDFGAVLDEMWAVAQQEMNFLLEAEHIERFSRLNDSINYVGCPKVYHQLTTSKVLVMEQIKGYSIDQTELLQDAGYDIKEIGLKLAENYTKQILDDAFFHADPHQGNIRVSGGKIVFIDLGMMGTLSERDRGLIREAIESLAAKNINKLKEVLLTLGKPLNKINHSELYSDLDMLVRRYLGMDIGGIDMGELITELLELCGTHKISMPSTITMLARGILTIEGVLCECCPGVNLLQIITAHLAGESFKKLNLEKELKDFAKNGYSFIKRGIEIPVTLADMLSMAVKGELKTNLEIVGSDEPLRKINSMVTRIIVCIITSSLLLGSSVICTTQMEPRFFGIPIFGAVGYFGAIILGIWLIIYTFVINKRNKK